MKKIGEDPPNITSSIALVPIASWVWILRVCEKRRSVLRRISLIFSFSFLLTCNIICSGRSTVRIKIQGRSDEQCIFLFPVYENAHIPAMTRCKKPAGYTPRYKPTRMQPAPYQHNSNNHSRHTPLHASAAAAAPKTPTPTATATPLHDAVALGSATASLFDDTMPFSTLTTLAR